MKTIISAVLLAGICHASIAGEAGALPGARKFLSVSSFEVERLPFGSGTPGAAGMTGTEAASPVADGLYHVPNHMPGFPTAATIWPRELPLECEVDPASGEPTCHGYRVLPTVGRGEYIFVRPYAKAAPPPAVVQTPNRPAEPQPAPVTRKRPLG